MEAENQNATTHTATAPVPVTSSPPSPSTAVGTSSTSPPIVPQNASRGHDPQLERHLLDVTNEALMNKCRSFVEQLRDGAAPWIVQKLNESYGGMPTDAPSFSFWVALVSLSSHPTRGSRRRITGFSSGPPNRRIREGEVAADQKC